MKLTLDSCLPKSIYRIVKQNGFICSYADEFIKSNANDIELIETCIRKNTVLVTLDTNFADILKYPPNQYSGIIILTPRILNSENIKNLLVKYIYFIKEKFVYNRTYILGETGIIINS